jgi:hypothetical protein
MGVPGAGAAGCCLLRIDKLNGGMSVTIGAKQVPGLIDLISPKAGAEMTLLFSVSRCYRSSRGEQKYRYAVEILHGSKVGESICFS